MEIQRFLIAIFIVHVYDFSIPYRKPFHILFVLTGGNTDPSKGNNVFTESSNFSFISGGAEMEESAGVTGPGALSLDPVQELRTDSKPVVTDSETHELEESSGEGGFSFLNAPCPIDETTPPEEAPPPPKAEKTPPTTHLHTLSASRPPLPPDVVQQPKISPAPVVGGGAKKAQRKKKLRAARPGVAAESIIL